MTLVEKVASELLDEWQLAADGAPREGISSLVLPVRTPGGRPAVLKVGAAEQEALALQHWHGNGAVQLLRADPHRRALLLERLHDETLEELWDLEACELVAERYSRLHVPAPPRLRRLSDRLQPWRARLEALPPTAPVPRRLVEQSLAIVRDLAADGATDGRLVHGDLHYAHVLAGDREPWIVIAPEPVSGDPHFEPAPMLWHRWDEVVASGDARDAVRRRFFTLVDAAGLDEDRTRDWAVLRVVLDAVRELDEPHPDASVITRSITIAKAVQE